MTKVMIVLTGLWLFLASPVRADDDPEPPRPRGTGPVTLQLVAKKSKYKLDLGGQSKADYVKAIEARRATRVPVDLSFVITNNSNKPIRVQTAGNKINQWLMGWTLNMTGPGAASGGPYWSDKKDQPPPAIVVLRPGAKTRIPINGLMSHMASTQVRDHFWTEPGKYKLSATLHLPVDLDGDENRPQPLKPMKLETPAIEVTVEK